MVLLLAMAVLAAGAGVCEAVVGELDTEDQFPFVVQLKTRWSDGSKSRCSGVVHGHVLSTAAHCLYEVQPGPSRGWADRVEIEFEDAAGIQRSAVARRLYAPKEYTSASTYSFDIAPYDIGYAALDAEAVTKGYIRWGLELTGLPHGKSTCEEAVCMDWSLTPEWKDRILGRMQAELGDLAAVKVRIVGFGNFYCKDFNDREGVCVDDGRRRYVELTLLPGYAKTPAPWFWCTGQSAEKINPVQHGDSGGPVFVQARDGRWIYVGYTSGGNSSAGCASSMFNKLELWVRAVSAYETLSITEGKREAEDDTIEAWHESIAEQSFKEWLAAGSAPADIGLVSTMNFYDRYTFQDSDCKLERGTYTYNGKKVTWGELCRIKKAHFDRRPRRQTVSGAVSVSCNESERHGYDTCTVKARVSTIFHNPFAGGAKTEQSEVALVMRMPHFDSKAILMSDYKPTIERESNVVVTNINDANSISETKEKVWRVKNMGPGYANVRSGPGQHESIVGQAQSNTTLRSAGECQAATDSVSKFPFCPVWWDGSKGWVSAYVLE